MEWHPPERPDGLVCPITQCLFKQVSLASDGFHYERRDIIRWLAENRPWRSPVTGAPLHTDRLYPDENVQKIVDAYRHKCVENFTAWWKVGQDSDVCIVAKSILTLAEILDHKDCVKFLSAKTRFDLLAHNTNEIISFLRNAGVLCCLCGNRLAGRIDPSLCHACLWEFIRGFKTVGCVECGSSTGRSNDDCNVCGPLTRLVELSLHINHPEHNDPGTSHEIEVVDSNRVNVYFSLEQIKLKYGSCVRLIKTVKWNSISLYADKSTAQLFKIVQDIVTAIPGMYDKKLSIVSE